MFTQNEIKIFGPFMIALVFIAILFFQNRNNTDSVAHQYIKIDYIIAFSLISILLIIELVCKFYSPENSLPRGGLISILLMGLTFLSTGFINIKYKKEINNYTNYQFGVGAFICGWVAMLYLIAEFLR